MEDELQRQGALPPHLVRQFADDARRIPTAGRSDTLYNVAKGWHVMNGLLTGDEVREDPYHEMHEALRHINWHGEDISRYNPQLSKDLYRYKHAYYSYLSIYPQAVPKWDDNDKDAHLPRVIMVAEKPSVAKAIAEALSRGRMRMRRGGISRACQTHEFNAYFPPAGERCKILCTSVVGHIFGLDFSDKKVRDPADLYSTGTEKVIEGTTAKLKVVDHLQSIAEECEYMALWLDCDREGENICFEVMGVCREQFPTDENVYRAHFSALTETELTRAFQTLERPNKYLAMAVDARQELDLKVGVSFTRLLTRSLLDNAQRKFFKDLRVISYGPCQTPTLWFCVTRATEIEEFLRERYWKPVVVCQLPRMRQTADFEWANGTTSDPQVKYQMDVLASREHQLVVQSIRQERKTVAPPTGLNTVQMLKSASTGMGMSPTAAMKAAEHLYTSGYISYPRTESTRYPDTFDVRAVLQEQSWHPHWGKTAAYILRQNRNIRPPVSGNDAGDHPPITPMKCAPRDDISKGKEWKLYDFVTRHFIASLMDPFEYMEYTVEGYLGNELFKYVWHEVVDRGFVFATPWKQKDMRLNIMENAPQLRQGMALPINSFELGEMWTQPPDFLKESDLIGLMDQQGIGTDASIPQHVQNICDRRYVEVCGPGEDGRPGSRILNDSEMFMRRKRDPSGGKPEQPKSRHMVPTSLGKALIAGYNRLDKSLCEPSVRAYMEQQVKQIAEGSVSKQEVIDYNLDVFLKKFINFRDKFASVFEPIFRPKQMGSYRDFGDEWGGGGGNEWGGGGGNKWGGGGGSGRGKGGRQGGKSGKDKRGWHGAGDKGGGGKGKSSSKGFGSKGKSDGKGNKSNTWGGW
eukprot:GEMP01013564.1.p1 GENE.GEMP01013564.1~~GEMP01013564.1.p1  ORF type:complete len:860 (+),score=141.73 GEMP01013564.1:77-2656(+)